MSREVLEVLAILNPLSFSYFEDLHLLTAWHDLSQSLQIDGGL